MIYGLGQDGVRPDLQSSRYLALLREADSIPRVSNPP
jgi:hypothetical protein